MRLKGWRLGEASLVYSGFFFFFFFRTPHQLRPAFYFHWMPRVKIRVLVQHLYRKKSMLVGRLHQSKFCDSGYNLLLLLHFFQLLPFEDWQVNFATDLCGGGNACHLRGSGRDCHDGVLRGRIFRRFSLNIKCQSSDFSNEGTNGNEQKITK